MTIAAHLFPRNEEPSFLLPCCLLLAKKYPEHAFVFFADPQQVKLPPLPSNCSNIRVSPTLRNGLLMHYWYNFKLPSLLTANKVSVFLSESNVCSIRTAIPQCLLLRDLQWMQKKNYSNDYAAYNRRFFSKFVQAADAVIVTEEHMIEILLQKYPVLKDKITFSRYGIPEAYSVPAPEKHSMELERIAGGHEYFLCACPPSATQHLTLVLKAFSLFKKRMKSAMQLLIVLPNVAVEAAIPDFKNYKYRGDVVFIDNRDKQQMQVTQNNAYAFIYLDSHKTVDNAGLYVMQAGVPVIAVRGNEINEIYKEAALYCSLDEQSIADQMMALYKDESLRKQKLDEGFLLASGYDWRYSAGKLWQTILDIGRD